MNGDDYIWELNAARRSCKELERRIVSRCFGVVVRILAAAAFAGVAAWCSAILNKWIVSL